MWTHVPFRADHGATPWTTWPAGCDDQGDLTRQRFGGWQCRAARKNRSLVFVLLDVVREDRDALMLFVVADRHFADDILGDVGRERRLPSGRFFRNARADEPSEPELLEELLDSQAECLQLFFLHPQRDEVEAAAGDQAKAPLAWLADRLRLEHSELRVFVPFHHLPLRVLAGRRY
ncbi:hypothetical protein HRbin27_01012 [bacterium HR27]|nr:hypothetical protein HRbin27_01012 [bacterium HR27]